MERQSSNVVTPLVFSRHLTLTIYGLMTLLIHGRRRDSLVQTPILSKAPDPGLASSFATALTDPPTWEGPQSIRSAGTRTPKPGSGNKLVRIVAWQDGSVR